MLIVFAWLLASLHRCICRISPSSPSAVTGHQSVTSRDTCAPSIVKERSVANSASCHRSVVCKMNSSKKILIPRGRGRLLNQQPPLSSHFETNQRTLTLNQENFPELPKNEPSSPGVGQPRMMMPTSVVTAVPPTVMTPECSPILMVAAQHGNVPVSTAVTSQQPALQFMSPIIPEEPEQLKGPATCQPDSTANAFPYIGHAHPQSQRADMMQQQKDNRPMLLMANQPPPQVVYQHHQPQHAPHPQYYQQQPQPMYTQAVYEGGPTQYSQPRYIMIPPGQHPSAVNYVQPPMWMCPAPPPQHFDSGYAQRMTPPEVPMEIVRPPSWMSGGTCTSEDKAVDATKTHEDKVTQTTPQKATPTKPRPLLKTTMKDEEQAAATEVVQKKVAIEDDDWKVPNAKPEELHGWDTPSPSEKRATSQMERSFACLAEAKNGRLENEGPEKEQAMKVEPKEVEQEPASNGGMEQSSGQEKYFGFDFKKANEEAESYRNAKLASMTKIIKDVYKEHPSVTNLTDEKVLEIRTLKNLSVNLPKPEELSPLLRPDTPSVENDTQNQKAIPKPVTSFEQAYGDYPEILSEVQKQGFSEPTPIQSQIWPCIMKGMDVVGIAQTGSGKTLGFLLPAFIHIETQVTPRSERKSPTVLILAPTRELVQQIHKEVSKYSYKGIKSVCIYGGNPKHEQVAILRENPEIVIATPGRLNDLVASDQLNLAEVSFLVLDEADEMLNQGFEPQINKALIRVRHDRQTVLTSATWPQSVRRMAKNYTKDPILVIVGTVDLRAVQSVKQNVVFKEENEKFEWLVDFLKNKMTDTDKLIVFVGKKSFADHLSSELGLMRWPCVCIHGGLPQSDRDKAIVDMKSGESRVLIASDVVARGIDIECVTYIINYDVPRSSEQYIHRIGRTGRAGKTGESFTLIARRDWGSAQHLVEIISNAGQEVPAELIQMAERFKNRTPRGGGGRNYHNNGNREGGFGGRQEGGFFGGGYGRSDSNFGGMRNEGSFGGRNEGGYGGRNGGGGSSYGSSFQRSAPYSSNSSERGQRDYSSDRGGRDYSNRGQNRDSSSGGGSRNFYNRGGQRDNTYSQ
ncbi:uncharacterized protein LOC132201055 [Neocloeon triangulifer]|uniref:uncharacterized protein LOC132201055 n=1 Tax=Neocloeon triangulifer TaxID=2078957 RepID=UPI00286ED2F6|nr:uncharacterized protein LOC132201055 [Neocloeon triangulifer]